MKTLRRHTRRCHGFVLRGQAASRCEQRLAPFRHEAFVRDLIVIVDQPGQAWLRAGVKLDRPRGSCDSARELGSGNYVAIAEDARAFDLTALAHTHLNAGIVDKAALAPNEVITEETAILGDLPASLDLRLREIGYKDAVELTAIGSDDPSAVAQKLAGTRC